MYGLSRREMQVIANLEFLQKHYFTRADIAGHFHSADQLRNTLYRLRRKGRVVLLNKGKYYLVPIKARTGVWAEHPLILADELFGGRGYYVGGWAAASYWKLTDQVPMQVDIYTTRRQGKHVILGTRFVFHRTTEKRTKEAVVQRIGDHPFHIISKERARKWLRSRR